MPSGNGCRAAMKRARNAAEANKAGPSTAEDRKKQEASRNAVQCNICLTGFPRTVGAVELQQHLDSKHAKAGKTIADAFPDWKGDASS